MEMREAANPLFIVVHSPYLLIRFQNVRDSTKIKIDAMVCLGPQETVILHNVAFRQVTGVNPWSGRIQEGIWQTAQGIALPQERKRDLTQDSFLLLVAPQWKQGHSSCAGPLCRERSSSLQFVETLLSPEKKPGRAYNNVCSARLFPGDEGEGTEKRPSIFEPALKYQGSPTSRFGIH